jgi:hypothetical protein
MKLEDAKARLVQIFEEERRYPTVSYSLVLDTLKSTNAFTLEQLAKLAKLEAETALRINRVEEPRTI